MSVTCLHGAAAGLGCNGCQADVPVRTSIHLLYMLLQELEVQQSTLQLRDCQLKHRLEIGLAALSERDLAQEEGHIS